MEKHKKTEVNLKQEQREFNKKYGKYLKEGGYELSGYAIIVLFKDGSFAYHTETGDSAPTIYPIEKYSSPNEFEKIALDIVMDQYLLDKVAKAEVVHGSFEGSWSEIYNAFE